MSASILIRDASVPELLAEIARRFDARPAIPAWAEPVMVAVSEHFRISLSIICGRSRRMATVQVRWLCLSLLAQYHPDRTHEELTQVVGRSHEMLPIAVRKTEDKLLTDSEFRTQVRTVVRELDAIGARRAAPQGTAAPNSQNTSTRTIETNPA